MQHPISLVASEGSLSAKLDTRRAELLSDGYIRENPAERLEIPTNRGHGDTREDAPVDDSNSPSYSPSLNDSNVGNVFRKILGAEQSKYLDAKHTPLLATDSEAETAVMGSAGKSIEARGGPKPEQVIMTKSSTLAAKPAYSWRMDPSQSFSDWEIKIVSSSGQVDTYNVHRMALAAGPRASRYFSELFSSQLRELKSQRLRLEMPSESAAIFPVFLDFVYGEDDIASVKNKEQAYAVYDQAEFFDTPMLKHAVKNWIDKRLSWYEVPTFLPQLERFQDKAPLVEMAVQKCAKGFEELGTDFGSKIEPKYLTMILDVLHVKHFMFSLGIDYVSEMVIECCNAHPGMDQETFVTLTSETFLPNVPVEGIVRLLEKEAQFCEDSNEITSLQKRCIDSLLDNWEYFSFQFPSKDEMSAALTSLPKIVLAQVLVQISALP